MGKGRISPPNGLKSHSITQETMRSKEKQKKKEFPKKKKNFLAKKKNFLTKKENFLSLGYQIKKKKKKRIS